MQNSKEEHIINALLTHPTIRQAAEALQMPESTVYNYLRKPGFKTKYNQAKGDLLLQGTTHLQALITRATKTVTDIMDNPENPAQTRLAACRTILEYALKLTEQADIMPRLEALEQEAIKQGLKISC